MRNWAWIVLLPLVGAFSLLPVAPAWQMALIAVGVFLVVKAQTLVTFEAAHACVPASEKFSWYLGWPGLNADGFFTAGAKKSERWTLWFAAVLKMLFGVILVVAVAPQLLVRSELLAGWVALVGLLFVFHFGLFHLVALGWRAAGRDVLPIMEAPLLATSLAEFWNRRWNRAFRDFAYVHVFRPAAKRWGATAASWVGFAFSGLIHELAISVPAHAGYGLPTCYFLLQGLGVSVERLAVRRGWWSRGGAVGWLFVVVCTVPGAFLLFHPPFIERVVVPLIPTW